MDCIIISYTLHVFFRHVKALFKRRIAFSRMRFAN